MQHDGQSRQDGGLHAAMADAARCNNDLLAVLDGQPTHPQQLRWALWSALRSAERLYGELADDDPLTGPVERAMRALGIRIALTPEYWPGGGWRTG